MNKFLTITLAALALGQTALAMETIIIPETYRENARAFLQAISTTEQNSSTKYLGQYLLARINAAVNILTRRPTSREITKEIELLDHRKMTNGPSHVAQIQFHFTQQVQSLMPTTEMLEIDEIKKMCSISKTLAVAIFDTMPL